MAVKRIKRTRWEIIKPGILKSYHTWQKKTISDPTKLTSREEAILRSLRHRNVVSFLGRHQGQDGTVRWETGTKLRYFFGSEFSKIDYSSLVMKLYGPDLSKLVSSDRNLGEQDACFIVE